MVHVNSQTDTAGFNIICKSQGSDRIYLGGISLTNNVSQPNADPPALYTGYPDVVTITYYDDSPANIISTTAEVGY